jgi:TRAP-type mannitol/chloroaromatic compound transport system substrate-binding protein
MISPLGSIAHQADIEGKILKGTGGSIPAGAQEDNKMCRMQRKLVAPAEVTGAVALSLTLILGAAWAEEKAYVMRVSLATINDPPHQLAKNFAAVVEWYSDGRIKGEIYPASQLGAIPRQIEGVQLGAIQAAIIPPEFFVGVDERFEVMAASGLVDSLEHGQRVATDRAVLRLMLGLGAQKGLHGAGLSMYQPSSVISRRPLRHLADFQGKKIRIYASDFQSEAFRRLGAAPARHHRWRALRHRSFCSHAISRHREIRHRDRPAGYLRYLGSQPEMV